MQLTFRTRLIVFGAAFTVVTVLAMIEVVGSTSETRGIDPINPARVITEANPVRSTPLSKSNLDDLLSKPHFLSVRSPDRYGEPYALEVIAATDPLAPRIRTDLSCVNVHFRAGRGICVTPPIDPLATTVTIVDQHLRVTRTITLPGSPSRARMSPDGTHGAITNFLSGHSYADATFTTATTIFDFTTGASSNLETWTAFNDKGRIPDKSRNFWGVTFLDDNTFFVAMGVRGDRYLLKGNPDTHELSVIGTHMECPSVAPDGRHLTFRRAILETNGSTSMPLFLLDLETMTERRLTFNDTVDGQPEWLDNRRITIGTPTGPPNIAVIDINDNLSAPKPWTVLVPDSLSISYVDP